MGANGMMMEPYQLPQLGEDQLKERLGMLMLTIWRYEKALESLVAELHSVRAAQPVKEPQS